MFVSKTLACVTLRAQNYLTHFNVFDKPSSPTTQAKMHRYTTADVAEAAGRVRPVVVRVLREPPSADGSWDITPSPIKTGTPQTMASSKPKADHASLTLRPHMIQLGLALQLASGTQF